MGVQLHVGFSLDGFVLVWGIIQGWLVDVRELNMFGDDFLLGFYLFVFLEIVWNSRYDKKIFYWINMLSFNNFKSFRIWKIEPT